MSDDGQLGEHRSGLSGRANPRDRPDLLVIEDDATIRQALALGMERDGFNVRAAADGPSGLAAFFEYEPDLVLLDVMLPGFNGIHVCRTIRAAAVTPIVMLTARTEAEDIIAGLNAGADDYVVKPFIPAVLSARLTAVLRRSARSTAPAVIELAGQLAIDPATGEARRDGHRLALTPTEYRLLYELARSAGTTRTREDLLAAVWDYDWSGDSRLVDVHVQRLRAKIGSDIIETVYGQGYRAAPAST